MEHGGGGGERITRSTPCPGVHLAARMAAGHLVVPQDLPAAIFNSSCLMRRQ
jgi:hypothetical protein